MGQIRTKDIKDLARDLYAAYPDKLSIDFENNKSVINDLNIMEGKSKIFRNRVAGYVVRLAHQAVSGRHTLGERTPELGSEESEVALEEEQAAESAEEEPEQAKEE
jgi:ribosomal protein S17E